jgi:hypothetical protein
LRYSSNKWVKQTTTTNFSVIDLDKGLFPDNYVCTFPKTKSGFSSNSMFAKMFAANALSVATELLTKAKKEFSDREIQFEINSRLEKIKKLH